MAGVMEAKTKQHFSRSCYAKRRIGVVLVWIASGMNSLNFLNEKVLLMISKKQFLFSGLLNLQ